MTGMCVHSHGLTHKLTSEGNDNVLSLKLQWGGAQYVWDHPFVAIQHLMAINC